MVKDIKTAVLLEVGGWGQMDQERMVARGFPKVMELSCVLIGVFIHLSSKLIELKI